MMQTEPTRRAILSDRAPDLLVALVEWRIARRECPSYAERRNRLSCLALAIAVDDAGLLAEPSQPAPLPAMWCGADAFTQEDSDGR